MIKKIATTVCVSAAACLLFWGCPKPKPNVAPEPDTEVESAVDAAWALFAVSDIDMICSEIGEGVEYPKFYVDVPGTATPNSGTVEVTRHPEKDDINIVFNNTKCMDGRLRDGTIFMDYKWDPAVSGGANPNSEYMHDFGFASRVSLLSYKVDGWLIDEYDDHYPPYVYNLLVSNKFDPNVVQIKWKFAGKLKFTHPTDPSRNMIWEGVVFKTLVNTNDKKVYSTAKDPMITWSLSVCSYSGYVDGTTNATKKYRLEIGEQNQLVRDFTCYPDKVSDVLLTNTVGVLGLRYEEHHPFKSGIASFTTGDQYPRQIYFGNEGSPQLDAQCDDVGEVLIKGISYKVNFRK